jgi:hypothetical protein
MDFEKLIPFIKKALENNDVSIADIQEELQEGKGNPADDKDQELETVDNGVVDNSNPQNSDVSNDEGKLLESTFKEVEVEEAITRAKEEKDFKQIKQSSAWKQLANLYARNNSRKNSIKE